MTKPEVAKLLAVIMAAFPFSKLSDASSVIYERMLADLDYPAANAAVERLLATARMPPTIAEIRDATLTMQTGEVRPGGDAWGEVLAAIGRFGRGRVPGTDFRFKDPVTARCVTALGWRELCDSEMVTADRARFIELYDRLAAMVRRSQLSDHLPAAQRFRALQAGDVDRPVPLAQVINLLDVKTGDGEL